MYEVRFKGWDREYGKIFDVVEISHEGNKTLAWREPYDLEKVSWIKSGLVVGKECDLMQYVWLYDDTGKRIYSDDIVLVTDGNRIHVSKVNLDYFGVWIDANPFIKEVTGKFKENLIDYCDYGIGRGITQTCRVIGNIYENPELLNKK